MMFMKMILNDPPIFMVPINLHQMYKPAVLAVEPHKRDDRGTIERER